MTYFKSLLISSIKSLNKNQLTKDLAFVNRFHNDVLKIQDKESIVTVRQVDL
jgi:hypothetical protein